MKHHLSIILSLAATLEIFAADVTIPFSVPKDGRASLAVYNHEGQLVRTLLTGKPLAKGQHTATWDGLDRYGHALPAGGFELRTLKERVLIVGDAAGVLRGVDAFLARALHYVPQGSTDPGTDLVAAPISASSGPE